MRKQFLRDVIAGSAGVLAVLALIGLPRDHPALTQHLQVPVPAQGGHVARLLPFYTVIPRAAAPPLPARPTP
jgi:hypothetical protein